MRSQPLFLIGGLLLSANLVLAAPKDNSGNASNTTKPAPIRVAANENKPPIDIVFDIDCSGSMGGVIETAKQKIWDIVNQAAMAKPTPRLRIGLLGYGNGSKSYRKFDLSDDLDTVYKNLMTFKDEGWGDEYVGEAIQKSVEEMSWSQIASNKPSLRTIYVVGNETAQQGPIDYRKSTPHGKNKGIIVNAIYCGDAGGQDTWRELSTLGGGKYLEIAGDGASVMIPTPYDKQIEELNVKLNGTYLAYGALGQASAANQAVQDSNARATGGAYASASRAMAKASSLYSNSTWDLVDKSREKGFDLSKVATKDLPEPMRKMTMPQRKTYLANKQKERAALQNQLLELGKKRTAYLVTENKKKGRKDSLDAALNSTFSSQAAAGGFGGMSGSGK